MRLLPLACATLALACSKKLTGPTPELDAAQNPLTPATRPAPVCNAQGIATNGWEIDVLGASFAPLPVDLLTSQSGVILPSAKLGGAQPFDLPADRVFFVDSGKLVLLFPTANTSPAVTLAPGTYDLTVANPNDASATLTAGIEVVPPPALTNAAVTAPFSTASDTPVQIDGSGFRPGAVPAVTIVPTGATSPVTALTGVTVVSAAQLTATVPAGTPEGVYDLTVVNPEGCGATLFRGLSLREISLGILTIDPRFGWQLQNQPITIYNAPTGTQIGFSPGVPQIFINAPLKSAPGTTVAIPLRRIAFVSTGVVTAVVPDCSGLSATPAQDAACPDGIAAGGPYSLTVRDPSGAVGTIPATNGFVVLTDPPPVITSIAPTAIDTRGVSDLAITGDHFGAGAKPQIVEAVAGGLLACNLPTVTAATPTSVHASVPTTVAAANCTHYDAQGNASPSGAGFSLSAGQYVIRVQDAADPAFADFAALTVRNPAANPAPGPAIASTLNVARGDFDLLEASDDLGRHYLYAAGGTSGAADLSSVEVAPISPFGDVGAFQVLDRTPLGTATEEPRRGAAAVSRFVAGDTGYVYLVGGVSGTATLGTVLRAQVLRAADAPVLSEPAGAAGGSLAAGVYYYRVSAVLGTNPVNPDGETLASDEYPFASTTGAATAKLTWSCVPGATRYRVYRSPAANGTSGSEQLLAETPPTGTCTTGATETYSDTGGVTPGGDRPLPPGALGHWVQGGTLGVARSQSAALLVGDDVYVAGGFCTQAGGACPAANAALASVEKATFGAGTPDLGAFGAAGTLAHARRQLSLTLADALSAPSSFTSASAPDNRQDQWLLAVGGDASPNLVQVGVIEAAQIRNASGAVAASWADATYTTAGSHGGWAHVLADYLVMAGTDASSGFSFRSGIACPGSPPTRPGQCTGLSSFTGTLPATGVGGYARGGDRYLGGEELFRAFVYVAGGLPTPASTTPTNTIERLTY